MGFSSIFVFFVFSLCFLGPGRYFKRFLEVFGSILTEYQPISSHMGPFRDCFYHRLQCARNAMCQKRTVPEMQCARNAMCQKCNVPEMQCATIKSRHLTIKSRHLTLKCRHLTLKCRHLTLNFIFRAKVPKSLYIAAKSSLLEFSSGSSGSSGSTGSTGSTGSGPQTVARHLPSTRAGGQDDGSQTNSLKQVCVSLVCVCVC